MEPGAMIKGFDVVEERGADGASLPVAEAGLTHDLTRRLPAVA
jgi:hypothetical protein